ncbi:acyl-CoA dehydrogenase family protein [Seohaeicola saemankumensis]|uniref:Medium-chain specific acyl-CoA dehydrogenase, mitochondrial n=1 Tax=Seohaeicola saemankumensis TaxID=481181 RepID=A0ABW3TA66_9RHOB
MTRQADHLAQVRAFAATTLAPAAARWTKGDAPDPDLFRAAAALGLFGIELPVEAGGLSFDFAHKAAVCATLAAVDFGFAMSVVNTHNAALRLHLSAPTLAARHLPGLLSGQVLACTALTEPGAGTDVAALQTRATQTADGWMISGHKDWIINARHAGLSIVFAKCGAGDDGPAIGAFLVDLTAPGATRHATEAGFAQDSMGTGGFILDGVALPSEALILPPGTAFRAILSEINGARAYVAAMCCAMLGAAIDTAARYGQSRHSFSMPLMDHQAWRLALAQAQTDLAATHALTDRAIAAIPDDPAAQLLAAQAKVHAVQTCQQHLPALLHAMGAEGLRPTHCLTRHLAAVQSAALTDGAIAPLLERVARLSWPATPPMKD